MAVDADGRVTLDALRAALRPDTVLVTLALANHELGNVYDIAALARVAHEVGALFHTDAVQAAGKIDVDVGRARRRCADAVGAQDSRPEGRRCGLPCAVGRRSRRSPAGGHQERERRAGTENVSGIVGFGVAARLAAAERSETAASIARLRDRLEARLLAIPGARRHGDAAARLPGTLNVGFADAPGQFVAAGSGSRRGSACRPARPARRVRWRRRRCCWRSGLSRVEAACAVRFGIGAREYGGGDRSGGGGGGGRGRADEEGRQCERGGCRAWGGRRTCDKCG